MNCGEDFYVLKVKPIHLSRAGTRELLGFEAITLPRHPLSEKWCSYTKLPLNVRCKINKWTSRFPLVLQRFENKCESETGRIDHFIIRYFLYHSEIFC